MNLTDPLGMTQISHSNLFIKIILILQSDLDKARISPNFEKSVQIKKANGNYQWR